MFVFALITGLYSYIIFLLGIFGILHQQYIWPPTFIYALIVLSLIYRQLQLFQLLTIGKRKIVNILKKEWILGILMLLVFLQVFINLLGALGPELAFDALWYHLTLPKLYLDNHAIFFIPGGLLYYSAMPKFAEMLYIPALVFQSEILVKLIHYGFGLLTSLAIYIFARQFFTRQLALLSVIIFYSNLVVAWESITAYVDLVRAFFEIVALWYFISWFQRGEKRSLVKSAFSLGLAISTKLLAFGSLGIFILLIGYKYFFVGQKSIKNKSIIFFRIIFVYLFIVLLVPLPWFIFSYIVTGNPVYPFFTPIYPVSSAGVINPMHLISEWWILFTRSADPISPLYLIMFPLVLILFKKFSPEMKIISLYSLLALIIWYITPRTGGGRFIMPYLPAFSLVCVAVIDQLLKEKAARYVVRFLIGVIIFISLTSIGYRFAANYKYIPVVFGYESKDVFLSRNLNYSFGDFYDIDGYFTRTIKPSDKVLLYGFHNLYYVNFPFIDATWVKRGDKFNYIATQNTTLPERFKDWKLLYSNKKSLVNLYSTGRVWEF